jgi:Flp pilus assembly protein TadG
MTRASSAPRVAGRQRSQALVEFAFALPVFAMLVFFTIQVGLLFISYYSEAHMAREVARWLAVSSATNNDTQVATQVQKTMLPGLIAGPTFSVTSPTAATLATSACTPNPGGPVPPQCDAVATVGNMTVRYTPCAPDVNNLCAYQQRMTGSTLFVEMTYDASNLMMFPKTFRLGSLVTQIPTTLPPYRVSVMAE